MLSFIIFQFFRLALIASISVAGWVISTIDRWALTLGSPTRSAVSYKMQAVFGKFLGRPRCKYCHWTIAPGDEHQYCNDELAIREGRAMRCIYCERITEPSSDKACPECRAAWEAYESEQQVRIGFCEVCGFPLGQPTTGCPGCEKRREEAEAEAWASVDGRMEKEETEEEICPCGHRYDEHDPTCRHCGCQQFGMDPELWEDPPQEVLFGDSITGPKGYE